MRKKRTGSRPSAADPSPLPLPEIGYAATNVLPAETSGVVPGRVADEVFISIWCELALMGQCDALGGAECRRIHQAWKDAGRPTGIAAFIRKQANRVPTAAERAVAASASDKLAAKESEAGNV